MEPSPLTVWYFAYGSNMNPSILTGRRGINPRRALLARCGQYALAFNVPGIPYLEPAMAGLRPLDTSPVENNRKGWNTNVPVHGIAYEISSADFDRVYATEGAGVAYRRIKARVLVLRDLWAENGEDKQELIDVITLVARRPVEGRRPSQRYLNLIIAAITYNRFPKEYGEMLERYCVHEPAPTSELFKLGRFIFTSFWLRVQAFVQWGIIMLRDDRGMVPWWFPVLFDLLMFAMWFHHDYIHAPVFGSGF